MKKNMFKISGKLLLIVALFSLSNFVSAGNSTPVNKENDKFNINLPAKISSTNSEFVYKFLLAEIAAQRGELNSAGHIYLDLAKLTKSASLAERATVIAGSARNGRLAMDSANIWRQLDKESIDIIIVEYLNRMSDLFFVLSRYANYKLDDEELTWNPNSWYYVR